MGLPRMISPVTNPNGYIAAIGAVYAASVMIYNAVHHHGVIDTNVVIAAAGAVLALFGRQLVTPVKDPRDASGKPLVVAVPPQLAPDRPVRSVTVNPPPASGQ